MSKAMIDPILGVNTLSKLGIVLDFNTKNITIDKIILSMQDTIELSKNLRLKGHGP